MNNRISILISAIVLSVLFVSNEAFAAIRRVPQTYATIQGAINAANAGDVILVSPGLYQENLNISKPISLKSVSGSPADTAIKGVDLQRATINVHDVSYTGNTVVIDGFYIYNGGQSWGSYTSSDGGIFVRNVNDIRIYGNWIGYNKMSGIHIANYVTKFDIRKNLITYNTADSTAGGGIYWTPDDLNTTPLEGSIINNVIAFNDAFYYGSGVVIILWNKHNLSKLSMINNTIAFNTGSSWTPTGAGIFVDSPSKVWGASIRNNIVYGNRRRGSGAPYIFDRNIAGVSLTGNIVLTYNDLEGAYAKWMGTLGYVPSWETNIDADPLFVNSGYTAPDLRLRVGSPCLNAGSPLDDKSNEPISNGGIIDIGASGNTSLAGGY